MSKKIDEKKMETLFNWYSERLSKLEDDFMEEHDYLPENVKFELALMGVENQYTSCLASMFAQTYGDSTTFQKDLQEHINITSNRMVEVLVNKIKFLIEHPEKISVEQEKI